MEIPQEKQNGIITKQKTAEQNENHRIKKETNHNALVMEVNTLDKDSQDKNIGSEKSNEILCPPVSHIRNIIPERTKKHQQSCVIFKMHYEAAFGESLYILGSISVLGSWRIEYALRMKWTEGNFWVGTIFQSDLTEDEMVALVEYKYGKAATDSPCQQFVVWEDGQNRTLYFPEVSQLCVDDVWSHRKVVLRLFETKSINDLYVLGDCEEIGTYESPQRMDKTPIEVNDNHFSSNFTVTQIDENIYLGPYPQSEDDIKQLSNRGIKAVLNLQTDRDMSLRGANYIMILRFYKQYNIQPFHFPVIDMDVIDMCYKLQDVSKLLHFLVTTLNKVYVHCTAGMFRSPQCVIGYYTYFKKMNVSEAIQKVESQHPQSKINKNYIEMVMSSTPVMTSCSLSDIDSNGTTRDFKTPQKLFYGLSDSEFAQFEEDEEDENNDDDTDDNYEQNGQSQQKNDVIAANSNAISDHKQHKNSKEEVEDKLHSTFTCS